MLTFQDVDYQGNKNLLEIATRAGVQKFVFVSVCDGPHLRHLAQSEAVKITSALIWIMLAVIFCTRLFNLQAAGRLTFFTTMATRDVVVAATGEHTLARHYQHLDVSQ